MAKATSRNPAAKLTLCLQQYCETLAKVNRARKRNIPLAEEAEKRARQFEAELATIAD